MHKRGHKLAVMQVTPAENLTSEILHLLGLDKFITYQEIYVAPKWDHIERYVITGTFYKALPRVFFAAVNCQLLYTTIEPPGGLVASTGD